MQRTRQVDKEVHVSTGKGQLLIQLLAGTGDSGQRNKKLGHLQRNPNLRKCPSYTFWEILRLTDWIIGDCPFAYFCSTVLIYFLRRTNILIDLKRTVGQSVACIRKWVLVCENFEYIVISSTLGLKRLCFLFYSGCFCVILTILIGCVVQTHYLNRLLTGDP